MSLISSVGHYQADTPLMKHISAENLWKGVLIIIEIISVNHGVMCLGSNYQADAPWWSAENVYWSI